MNKRISLIVATRRRAQEVKRLLDSLVSQTYQAFDVIVVDQNQDDRLLSLLQDYDQRLALRHIRSVTHGHAAANNVGLRICEGEIIAFPDDDCWYAPDLLRRIVDMFEEHPGWHGITGCEEMPDKPGMHPRFDAESGQVTLTNLWRRHISFSTFYRRAELGELLYDESLGIGAETIWGAGEETEFLLQFMKRGFVQYDPSVAVYHRDWGQGPYTLAAIAKARRYGMGMGRLLQTHQFSAAVTLKSFLRPLFGGAYMLLRGRPRKAVYHWSIFLGRTTGWMASLLLSNGVAAKETPRLSVE